MIASGGQTLLGVETMRQIRDVRRQGVSGEVSTGAEGYPFFGNVNRQQPVKKN
jgi:hypothetical protein